MRKTSPHLHSPGRRRLLIGAPVVIIAGSLAPLAAEAREVPKQRVIECAADLFEQDR